MSKDPVFLTDKNHTVILEAVTGVPNAAVPDTCKPFELLTPNTSEGAAEKHLPVVEIDGPARYGEGGKYFSSHD